MIQLIVGKKGHGKSLCAVWQMYQSWAAGRTIATNIELLPAHPAYDDVYFLDEEQYPIVSERGCFFNWFPPGMDYFIDEADVYFDSSDHAKIVRQVKLYLKQLRKRGDRVFMLVQDVDNLWVRIRRLTDETVVCVKDCELVPPNGMPRWLFRLMPESYHRFNRLHFSSWKLRPQHFQHEAYFTMDEAKAMFGWYNTRQLIGDCSFRVPTR